MNCPNCGTSNLDNARICVNCGRPLTGAPASPPPPQPPPQSASYTPPPPQPPPRYDAPGPGVPPAGAPVPNYLWQSIVVTLCCCLPLGIVAIIFAAQVNQKLAAGDLAGAMQASKQAKMWCMIGAILGLVGLVIGLIINGAAFMAALQDAR